MRLNNSVEPHHTPGVWREGGEERRVRLRGYDMCNIIAFYVNMQHERISVKCVEKNRLLQGRCITSLARALPDTGSLMMGRILQG